MSADGGSAAPSTHRAPLRWGTRPAESAELYVALDGPCTTMDVFPVRDGTIARWSPKSFGAMTPDGIDVEVSRGFSLEDEDEAIASAGGRLDDLWIGMMGAGSVFREAHLLQRKDGRWRGVAPLGKANMHYTAPQAWREGSLGLAIVAKDGDAGLRKLVGYDLPKEVVVAKLFPADVRLYQLHGLDGGEVVAQGRRGDETVLFLLGPNDSTAHALSKSGEEVDFVGRSRKTFRALIDRKAYRLEGDELVPEEAENAPEWRANGRTLQHLVGAGYQDVTLPPMPISDAKTEFDTLRVAPDGEAFVTVRWTGKSATAAPVTYHGLLRSRRPAETLRCSDHVLFDGPRGYERQTATPTGLEHWPPRATDACETPFVIVARYRARERVPNDLPKARSALVKHEAETGIAADAIRFVEVDTGGRKIAGIGAANLSQARQVAAALTQELRLEPEIVCGDPGPASADGGTP